MAGSCKHGKLKQGANVKQAASKGFLSVRPWRRRRYVRQKPGLIFAGLRGFTSQKTEVFLLLPVPLDPNTAFGTSFLKPRIWKVGGRWCQEARHQRATVPRELELAGWVTAPRPRHKVHVALVWPHALRSHRLNSIALLCTLPPFSIAFPISIPTQYCRFEFWWSRCY
jgi:hypothetical protein